MNTPPPSQMADIVSITALNTNKSLGQGGGQENNISPSIVNQNSLLAYNPVNINYIEDNGFERSQVLKYTVQPGDLLSFIASDYGVSVNSIIWANNLTDADSLRLGQILKIPPVTGVVHIVKSGDTIIKIAEKYGGEEENIISFNSLPKDGQLRVGAEIIVPDGKINTAYTSGSATARRFSYLANLGDYFMSPATGYNWGRIHGRNGVDIANSCGTPIYAAAGGNVALSDSVGWNGGFGKVIKLIHPNGTETLYAHASRLLVENGAYVARGQQIALMGSTGRSTGCHLHFEVHGAQNPLAKY
jgi:LysM repeat protein